MKGFNRCSKIHIYCFGNTERDKVITLREIINNIYVVFPAIILFISPYVIDMYRYGQITYFLCQGVLYSIGTFNNSVYPRCKMVFWWLFILINCGYCFRGPKVNTNSCSNIFQFKIDMNHEKFGFVTIPRTPIRKAIELVIVCVVNTRIPKVITKVVDIFLIF